MFTRCGYGAIGMQMETSEIPGDLLLQHPHFSCVIFCVICHQWRGDVLFSHQRSASVAWMHHFQKKKKTLLTYEHCSFLRAEDVWLQTRWLSSIPLVGPLSHNQCLWRCQTTHQPCCICLVTHMLMSGSRKLVCLCREWTKQSKHLVRGEKGLERVN